MDRSLKQASSIAKNPTRQSSQDTYKANEERYKLMLEETGINDTNYKQFFNAELEKEPVKIALSLILQRCGPVKNGFEVLKASATGGAIKSSVVNFWRSKGVDGPFIQNPDGKYTGNPGKCSQLQNLINSLDEAQRTARYSLTRRAYQETHEDVRKLFFKFVQPQLASAIRLSRSVDYKKLETAVINIMQFTAVARGEEMLSLKVTYFTFSGNSVDAPIIGVLPVTKNKKKEYTYFKFSRQVDVSICGLHALQGWLCVLRAHNVADSYLFPSVIGNQLQGHKRLDATTYGKTLKEMGESCGMTGLSEHSALRGGAGYHYFVLRRDLFFLYRSFSWESLQEMLRYVGLEDVTKSYALLGFTAFGTSDLAFKI